MDTKSLKKTAILAVFSILVTLAVLATSTYAWFTQNTIANTNRAEAKTSDADVVLLLSKTGGADFKGEEECEIVRLDKSGEERLMPVSTDDLKSFVYRTLEESFRISPESYYYHGRLYLKAESESGSCDRLALYLDDVENLITAEKDSQLLNAARLGLQFSNGDKYIYYLSDSNNSKADQARNTYIGGKLIADGNVLHSSGSAITVTTDPAIALTSSAITTAGASPLTYMNIDEIYTLDVYFYLEGCDPDCSDALWYDGAEMYLSFFGTPE